MSDDNKNATVGELTDIPLGTPETDTMEEFGSTGEVAGDAALASGGPTGLAESASGPGDISPEQVQEWRTKAAQAEQHWDRLLRLTADFDNFKKRVARERAEAAKYANEGLMLKLLPTLDNFDMALAAAQQGSDATLESIKAGISMVHSQLKAALTEAGLEEIEAQSQLFDPSLHEAVSNQETAEVPEDHVSQQLRKGYRLRDRLLRPAMVIVARKPAG
jgi:molecular chaperone GrpE